jgi:hypothetical protein
VVTVTNHATRCDACNARAYIVTILRRSDRLPRGGQLYWCRHHWIQHVDAALDYVIIMYDETHLLRDGIRDDGHVVTGVEGRPAPKRVT